MNSGEDLSLGLSHGTSMTSFTVVGRFVSTTILSDRYTASSTEWVMNTIVCPVSFRILMSWACRMFLVWASRAPKGSSIRTTSGLTMRARAIPTLCFMPPESSKIFDSAKLSSPTILRYLSTSSFLSDFGTWPISSPTSTFLRTVLHGRSAKSWNTNPRSLPGSRQGSSPMYTAPSVGSSRPAIILSRVVLPHPDGPMNETSSPLRISRLMLRMASVSFPLRV